MSCSGTATKHCNDVLHQKADACEYSVKSASYLARETQSTVGYGSISPWSYGGDQGFCRKPTSYDTHRALSLERMDGLATLFEWQIWVEEFVENI